MRLCWVITDGKAGMESQVVGLAEALGLDPVIKRVQLRAPWRALSPYLRLGHRHAFARGSDPLLPPWPDLLIATGRHSIAASLYVRAQSGKTGKRTVTVQVQNPVIGTRHFDLVIVPAHDRLSSKNVLSTMGALHRITPSRLALEASRLLPRLEGLPRPYISVLIGGANSAYRFGPEEMRRLGTGLAEAARQTGGGLIITASRRTSEENLTLLRHILSETPHFLWDGNGENPYFGMLGLADRIIVTGDSVNMVSEAIASGKPVQVFDLPGGSAKFQRFHAAAKAQGGAGSFPGGLPEPGPVRVDDMARAAEAVRETFLRVRGERL